MKKFFRYLCIGIGAASALVVITLTAFYFIGEHIISTQRTTCMGSEDFVTVRSKLKAALEDGTIDQLVMDRENEGIANALEACALGDKDKSRILLMNVMMDTSLQTDEVYARKINGHQGKKDQQ